MKATPFKLPKKELPDLVVERYYGAFSAVGFVLQKIKDRCGCTATTPFIHVCLRRSEFKLTDIDELLALGNRLGLQILTFWDARLPSDVVAELLTKTTKIAEVVRQADGTFGVLWLGPLGAAL